MGSTLYILSGFCLAFALVMLTVAIALVQSLVRVTEKYAKARGEAEFHKRVAQSNYESCQKLSAIIAQAQLRPPDDDADWWKKS